MNDMLICVHSCFNSVVDDAHKTTYLLRSVQRRDEGRTEGERRETETKTTFEVSTKDKRKETMSTARLSSEYQVRLFYHRLN